MQARSNQSLFMQPLINPLTAAANAAAASSSGTPAPAAITAMVCIYIHYSISANIIFFNPKTTIVILTNFGIFWKNEQNGDSRSLVDVKPRIADESLDKSKIWKLMEITESTQCRSIKLADNMRTSKVISYPLFFPLC